MSSICTLAALSFQRRAKRRTKPPSTLTVVCGTLSSKPSVPIQASHYALMWRWCSERHQVLLLNSSEWRVAFPSHHEGSTGSCAPSPWRLFTIRSHSFGQASHRVATASHRLNWCSSEALWRSLAGGNARPNVESCRLNVYASVTTTLLCATFRHRHRCV
jgi:hypothetical protein